MHQHPPPTAAPDSWWAASNACACSVAARSVASIAAYTASRPPARHASHNGVSSHAPVARSEMPRGPVRRTTPRTSSIQEWKTVAA